MVSSSPGDLDGPGRSRTNAAVKGRRAMDAPIR
jgi:hypothetical protein